MSALLPRKLSYGIFVLFVTFLEPRGILISHPNLYEHLRKGVEFRLKLRRKLGIKNDKQNLKILSHIAGVSFS